VAPPLTNLLTKDTPFVIDESCVKAFEKLWSSLVSAAIVQPPDFSLSFETMCDASDFAIGPVLGQRVNRMPYVIYYASRTLTDAQKNYSTTDHTALRHLLAKNDTKPRLIRWILLL